MSQIISKQQLVEAMADSMMEHIPSSPFFREYNKDDPGGYEWARGLAIILGDAALIALCKALPKIPHGKDSLAEIAAHKDHVFNVLKAIGASDER